MKTLGRCRRGGCYANPSTLHRYVRVQLLVPWGNHTREARKACPGLGTRHLRKRLRTRLRSGCRVRRHGARRCAREQEHRDKGASRGQPPPVPARLAVQGRRIYLLCSERHPSLQRAGVRIPPHSLLNAAGASHTRICVRFTALAFSQTKF